MSVFLFRTSFDFVVSTLTALHLFVFSLQLGGCGILGVGVWLSVTQGNFATLSSSLPSLSAANLLIAVGTIIMVIGCLGCVGAVKESRPLLLTVSYSLGWFLMLLLTTNTKLCWCYDAKLSDNIFLLLLWQITSTTFHKIIYILIQHECVSVLVLSITDWYDKLVIPPVSISFTFSFLNSWCLGDLPWKKLSLHFLFVCGKQKQNYTGLNNHHSSTNKGKMIQYRHKLDSKSWRLGFKILKLNWDIKTNDQYPQLQSWLLTSCLKIMLYVQLTLSDLFWERPNSKWLSFQISEWYSFWRNYYWLSSNSTEAGILTAVRFSFWLMHNMFKRVWTTCTCSYLLTFLVA